MKATRSFPILAALALAACVAAPLYSTTLAQLSLDQIASAATFIVRAKCISVESRWRDGEIWTVTTFHAEEIWKGDLPQEFQVWMLGGRISGIISYVPGTPRFHPGEEAVLFLESTRSGWLSITAWGEGTLRIRHDLLSGGSLVTQDTAILPVFDPVTRRFRASGIRDWPLEKLKARVLAAKAEGTGRWRKE